MWIDNKIIRQDLEYALSNSAIPWNSLNNATILVTGATGLIGQTIINTLLYYSLKNNAPLRILALVRDKQKVQQKFDQQIKTFNQLKFIYGDICNLPSINEHIEYIIHAAGETNSHAFVDKPIETIHTILQGTENLLKIALEEKVKGFVFLSSMEIYGAPKGTQLLAEDAGTTIDPMSVRSSYPESKRTAEALCAAYFSEHGVPAKVVRLAQTFGPGIEPTDTRVFAEFVRSALENKDIVLKTKGTSRRMYVYTIEAVTAILLVLLKGENGHAYNIANPTTYCSIVEMAQLIRDKFNNKITLRFSDNPNETEKYPPEHYINLDTRKIEALGWHPTIGLYEMYRRTIESLSNNKQQH